MVVQEKGTREDCGVIVVVGKRGGERERFQHTTNVALSTPLKEGTCPGNFALNTNGPKSPFIYPLLDHTSALWLAGAQPLSKQCT